MTRRWLAPLMLFLFTSGMLFAQDAYYHDESRPVDNPEWMKSISDNVMMYDISLPGTHDTMARFGGISAQTQSLKLEDQLIAGIRVLDIRCKLRDDELKIYHGSVSQNATFDDVLTTVKNFLTAHPSEAIIMRVSNEDGDDDAGNMKDFDQKVLAAVVKYKIFFQPHPINPTLISLGEMRGKVLMLQYYNYTDTSHGTLGLKKNILNSQDDWYMSSNWALYPKWEKVRQQLDNSSNARSITYYINYFNGNGLSTPYFVASGKSDSRTNGPQLRTGETQDCCRNKDLWPDFPRDDCTKVIEPLRVCSIFFQGIDWLVTTKYLGNGRTRLGMLMTDFPGKGLINGIIAVNNKLPRKDQLQSQSLSVPIQHLTFTQNPAVAVAGSTGTVMAEIVLGSDNPSAGFISATAKGGSATVPMSDSYVESGAQIGSFPITISTSSGSSSSTTITVTNGGQTVQGQLMVKNYRRGDFLPPATTVSYPDKWLTHLPAGKWVSGYLVRYAVTFVDARGNETNRGPWTSWFSDDDRGLPLLTDIPVDPSRRAVARKVYRQFFTDVQDGQPNAGVELIGTIHNNVSTKLQDERAQ